MTGRILGIDFGLKRIGLAIAEVGGTIALPLKTILNTPQTEEEIKSIVELREVKMIVVGRPVNPDNRSQKQVEKTEEWVKEVKKKIKCQWVFHDERRSSIQASQLLHQAGLKTKKQKKMIDTQAATVILQSYLDGL